MSGSKCKSSGEVAGTAKKLQELEAQGKDEERQEDEEITEELKRFMTQEMARGFSLFEEAPLVSSGTGPEGRMVHKYCSSRSECHPVLSRHL